MMFKDDKNIVDAIYRDESWIDPKAMPGAAENQFKHVKKVIIAVSTPSCICIMSLA